MRRARVAMAGLLVASMVAPWSGNAAGGTPAAAPRFTTVPQLSAQPATDGGGILRSGPNVNITNKTGAQSEAHVAVDPTNPRHILAASNDLSNFNSFNNVFESLDGGRTWANAGLSVNAFCYDPWLDFNLNGDAFFAYECSDQRIAFRRAGETQWTHTTLVGPGPFPDRDMVVVDTTASSPFAGSVYVGYDEANFNNAAHLMYSRTGFGAWAKSPTINDASRTIGVNASVEPDGGVNAVWLDFDNRRLIVDHSNDGGATWGTDHTVTNMRLPTQQFFICIPPQPDRCVVPMPFSTVSPAGTANAGRLLVTYPDRSTTGTDWDVFVRFSDDSGTTWSPEVRVNDDTVGAFQFFPAITVSPNGTVAVTYYDTRDDPNNEQTHRYIAFSTNGGATFGPNERVTTAPSDESGPGDANDYGDYTGIDPQGPNGFYSVWADSRTGSVAEDMFGARSRPL